MDWSPGLEPDIPGFGLYCSPFLAHVFLSLVSPLPTVLLVPTAEVTLLALSWVMGWGGRAVTSSRIPLELPSLSNSSPLLSLACPSAHLSAPLQNVQNFTLAQDEAGNVLLEDGKGRCPFDPNFKSTALVVGECWGQGGFMRLPGQGAGGPQA